MNVGDRVKHLEEVDGWPALGTITRVSPAGYVRVVWDENCLAADHDTYLSPSTAMAVLCVVTGDDALPLHDWAPKQGWELPLPKVYRESDYHCERCGIEQTHANYKSKCRPL